MVTGYSQFLLQQIQKNAKLKSDPNCDHIKNCVSNVLAACQEYMRKREVSLYICIVAFSLKCKILQDECSFVSLRDVERAMIVFEWFYDKTNVIEQELSKQEGYKVTITYFITVILVHV